MYGLMFYLAGAVGEAVAVVDSTSILRETRCLH